MGDMTDRVQHVKRGSTYRVIGCGKVQTDTPLADYAEVVIYQGENDGMIWCRPVAEFDDGRFAALPPSPDAVEARLEGARVTSADTHCSCGNTGPCMWSDCKHPWAETPEGSPE
jgi:hypothetical protein